MDENAAYGGGRAGAAQDPISFIKRPIVLIKLLSLVSAIIVFGGISSQGWSYSNTLKRDVCVLNEQSSACNFSTFVGVMGLIVSAAGIAGEWQFNQMSSVKTRKHYVMFDLAFSLLWAFFYLIAFVYMCIAWSKSNEQYSYSSSTVHGAMFFAFVSVASWSGSAYVSHKRYKMGTNVALSSNEFDNNMEDENYADSSHMPDDINYSQQQTYA